MKIYIHELSEEPLELDFTESEAWVKTAIHETEESHTTNSTKQRVHFELRRSQDIVFCRGELNIGLGLICSRCANAFQHKIQSSFQNLFTRDPKLTESSSSMNAKNTDDAEDTGDIEYLESEYLDLSQVLKEEVYLRIPFQPLCKEACKGICATCGQDQNVQPCQCFRLKNTGLANALKNFKV